MKENSEVLAEQAESAETQSGSGPTIELVTSRVQGGPCPPMPMPCLPNAGCEPRVPCQPMCNPNCQPACVPSSLPGKCLPDYLRERAPHRPTPPPRGS